MSDDRPTKDIVLTGGHLTIPAYDPDYGFYTLTIQAALGTMTVPLAVDIESTMA
jgi:hypothetical protein